LLLKNLRPDVIPEILTLQLVHDGLPRVLSLLNSLSRAFAFIRGEEDLWDTVLLDAGARNGLVITFPSRLMPNQAVRA
jgi:hypothetical protein